MNVTKKAKRWERTNVTNLWKLATSGSYYARVKVNGKEKWRSLNTKVFKVAKSRIRDFEREECAKGERSADAAVNTCQISPMSGRGNGKWCAGSKLGCSKSARFRRNEAWRLSRGLGKISKIPKPQKPCTPRARHTLCQQSLTMKHTTLRFILSACCAALLACVALNAQDDKDKDNLVPFKTDLPRPKLAGTPVAIKVANLETAADVAARPAVKIPAGSTNLALNKPVTASDSPITGELSMVTDGEKGSDEGEYVEIGDGKQWVQIDLEKERKIYAIALWHYHSQERAYHDVIVQISNDPEFKKDVTTVFNNDHDNSYGLGAGKDKAYVDTNKGRVIQVDGVSGRFVRLHSRGNNVNSANHYIEVEVWGK